MVEAAVPPTQATQSGTHEEGRSSPSSPEIVDALIIHARHELALRGARALSFRRLAAAAGTTLATLSYHLGSKARIVQTLVEAERERERVRHQAWRERLAPLPRFDPAALGALIELYLDESIAPESSGGARLTSLIWADLVMRAGVDATTAELLRPWLCERRQFWLDLFAGRMEHAEVWADLVMCYATDEGIHSLALGHLSDYRLLRRMAIERLVNRLDPAARGALGSTVMFEAVVRGLDPGLGLAGAGRTSDLLQPGRRRDIAIAACEVILSGGVEALTHRAVAERVGIPPSSVAYHFRSGTDLLWAGQQAVYLVAQGRLSLPGDGGEHLPQRVTMRGTLSIALAAARDPLLSPQAADLRRLRGENLTTILRSQGNTGIDALDGQTVALTLLGAAALADADAASQIAPIKLMDWMLVK